MLRPRLLSKVANRLVPVENNSLTPLAVTHRRSSKIPPQSKHNTKSCDHQQRNEHHEALGHEPCLGHVKCSSEDDQWPDRYDRVWISGVLWAEYSESGVAARGDCKNWKDHEQYSLPLIGPAVRDFGAEPCKGYAFSVRRDQGGLGDLPDLPCRRICPILLVPCKHSWRR